MRRRDALKLTSSAVGAWLAAPVLQTVEPNPTHVLDAHIHLFNPARPGGVPWPEPGDRIYLPALPDRYEKIARPLGVAGAIAIEASPLAGDNDWLLQAAASNPVIVGVVGDLIPGASDFPTELERLRANPLFRGIRYGNLWNRNLWTDAQKPQFLSGLKLLADLDLGLDTANPDAQLIKAALYVSSHVPKLRIVIDHLPAAVIPATAEARKAYWENLQELSRNPNIFAKLSEVPVRIASGLQRDPAYYQARLDVLWEMFGEDHVLFGSDWPNSDHVTSYADTLALVRSYVERKGFQASRKFFWTNSISAYKWKPRRADQRRISAALYR